MITRSKLDIKLPIIPLGLQNHHKLFFSEQYSKYESQSNDDAYEINRLLTNFIEQNFIRAKTQQKAKISLLTQRDIQNLLTKFQQTKKYQILLKCQYGSAVSFQKQNDFSQTVVRIHFPLGWGCDIIVQKEDYKYVPSRPKEFKDMVAGKLCINELTQTRQMKLFGRFLYQNIKKFQSNKKQNNKLKIHHTPTWLYERLSQTINYFNQFVSNKQNSNVLDEWIIGSDQQQEEQEGEEEQGNVQNKNGNNQSSKQKGFKRQRMRDGGQQVSEESMKKYRKMNQQQEQKNGSKFKMQKFMKQIPLEKQNVTQSKQLNINLNKKQLILKNSKGGTLDVGPHTGTTKPNTILQTLNAFYNYFYEDGHIFEKIIQTLKIYQIKSLLKITAEVKYQKDQKQNYQTNLIILKKCFIGIVSIINSFRNDNRTQFNEQWYNQKIKSIHQSFQQFLTQQPIIKKISISQIQKSLSQQLLNKQYQKFKITPINQYLQRLKFKSNYKQINIQNQQFNIKLDLKLNLNIIKDLMGKLQEFNSKEKQYWWILNVEDFFYKEIQRINRKDYFPFIPIKQVSSVSQNQKSQKSQLQKLVEQYEKLMLDQSNLKQYGMKLINQVHSHVYLVKYIACVVSFQVIRKNRNYKRSNLQSYTVPLRNNIEKLALNFYSLSYKARIAMINLLKYVRSNNSKKQIFILQQSADSYKNYVQLLANDNLAMKNWINLKRLQLQNQKEQIRKKIVQNINNIKLQKQKRQIYINKDCQCQQRWCYFRQNTTYWWVCPKCKQLPNIQSRIRNYQSKKQQYILSTYNKNNIELYAFIQNIPKDILGMMKLFYYCQINKLSNQQKVNQKKNYFKNNFDNYFPQYGQIIHFAPYVYNSNYFDLNSQNLDKIQQFIIYPSENAYFYAYGYKKFHNLDTKLFQAQKIERPQYQFMLDHPSQSNKTRQHQCLSNAISKPRFKSYQQWLGYAGIRITSSTQLAVLSQLILKREISHKTLKTSISNSQQFLEHNQIDPNKMEQLQLKKDFNHLQMLIILNTMSSLKSYYYLKNHNNIESVKMTQQSIQEVLQKYVQNWRFQDFYFLHILGVYFALFSSHLNRKQYTIRLAEKAFQEYKKFCLQKDDGQNEKKSKKTYFLQGILCLFMENMIQKTFQKRTSILFMKLLLLYETNKIFNDQNIKSQSQRQTINYFDKFKQKCVYENISGVLTYFSNNPMELTEVVEQVDNGIDKRTVWIHNQSQNNYQFNGVFGGLTYKFNLLSGKLLKNGQQIRGTPENIKNNFLYKRIFGINRNLQVLPQAKGSLRTTLSFNNILSSKQHNPVYFEFNQLSNNYIFISYIIKIKDPKLSNLQIQQQYVLIPSFILNKLSVQIPLIYLKNYFAWYCKQKNHIVFRRKKLEQMKIIGMIIQTKLFRNHLYIEEGIICGKKYQNYQIDNLLEKKNRKQFETIEFFRKRNEKKVNDEQQQGNSMEQEEYCKKNKALQILKQIQEEQFIIQIKCSQQSQSVEKTSKSSSIIKFWLHRYNLKFKFDSKKGLISQNYNNYAIDQTYHHHIDLPWKQDNKIKVLVLKKIVNNTRTCNLNDYIVLIPDTQIGQNGQMIFSNNVQENIKIFKYQIHNNFHDLRAQNFIQQLHLCCLIMSVHQNKVVQSVNMTSSQYVCHLLRSCYRINSLNQEEEQKFQKVMKIAFQMNMISVVLICEVIRICTNYLKFILPYDLELVKNYQQKAQDQSQQSSHINLINQYKSHYLNDLKQNRVPCRQKLQPFQLQVLNILKDAQIIQKKKMRNGFNMKIRQDMIEVEQKLNDLVKRVQINRKNVLKRINEMITQAQQMQIQQQSNDKEQFIQKKLLQHIKGQKYGCEMQKEHVQNLEESLVSYSVIKKELNKIKINSKNIKILTQDIRIKFQILEIFKDQFLKLLQNLQSAYKDHQEIISRTKSFITPRDFTQLLTDPGFFKLIYQNVSKNQQYIIKNIGRQWIKLSILTQSLNRIVLNLEQKQIDYVALLRQIKSPRDKINNFNPWLCFESEMRIQIWNSQYQTFNELNKSKNGTYTQLNMGEGKTQVIIPMLNLYSIYQTKQTPRVHFLSALYEQSKANYFKFFSISGFKLKILSIKFNRQVQIDRLSIKNFHNILNMFRNKCIIIIDRQSYLSMILKFREKIPELVSQKSNKKLKKNLTDDKFFNNLNCIDIFDQVDAYMSPKKSFVYSVGNSCPLPQSQIRYEVAAICLKIIAKQMIDDLIKQQIAMLEESNQHKVQRIKDGGFPVGFRFIIQVNNAKNQNKMKNVRMKLLDYFFSEKYMLPDYKFVDGMSRLQLLNLKNYCIDPKFQFSKVQKIKFLEQNKEKVFILRGLLGYGILQNCLSFRNGVDYGCPSYQHLKRVAVPYEAADIPSKRSQYSHPQVSIVLSYLSYFLKGLSFQNFQEALQKLLKLPQTSKNHNYKLWFDQLDPSKQPKQVSEYSQINMDSQKQIQTLWEIYKYNRSTIVFWLKNCVFPDDLIQYVNSITASCWDLGLSQNSKGFSGTKQNRWIINNYLTFQSTSIDQIKGTDGKMLSLILQNTIEIKQIRHQQSHRANKNTKDLWKIFLQSSLQLPIKCIIDSGAILAGRSLKNQIIPWLGSHALYKQKFCKGILFPDENGHWKVYDTTNNIFIQRNNTISEHETFVIFDEARTRGADIKMDQNICAAISLSPNMIKDKLMQSVGRLRKLGRNQKIFILGTTQILKKIQGLDLRSLDGSNLNSNLIKIIKWTCKNTINENKNMMYANFQLVKNHLNSLECLSQLQMQHFQTNVESMYKQSLVYKDLSDIIKSEKIEYKDQSNTTTFKKLVNSIYTYGKDYKIKRQVLDEICQRQIQKIEQQQKQIQIQFNKLLPIPQKIQTSLKINPATNVSAINLNLQPNLYFTDNFINCTQQKSIIKWPRMENQSSQSRRNNQNNELCKIKFVYLTSNQMVLITQQQMQNYCFGPLSIQKQNSQINFLFARFSDLKLSNYYIKRFNLQQSLINAQFFNGQQKFQNKQILLNTIKKNIQLYPNVSHTKIITHFLYRRRTQSNKFSKSHLEQIQRQIQSTIFLLNNNKKIE